MDVKEDGTEVSNPENQVGIVQQCLSAPTVYLYLGCETKVIFTFVPHPFYYCLFEC